MELILTHTGRLNFTQLARCGRSCESRFRQHFRKSFDWFWSGCAAAMKKGLEILGISIVDADAKDSVFLKAEQTFTDKKRGRKPGLHTKEDPLALQQIRQHYPDCKIIQVQGCEELARDGGALHCVTWNVLADVYEWTKEKYNENTITSYCSICPQAGRLKHHSGSILVHRWGSTIWRLFPGQWGNPHLSGWNRILPFRGRCTNGKVAAGCQYVP